MKNELTVRKFEVPTLLEQHNDLEQAICRTVFQDKYSTSVKTYHVIDHLISRGTELGLMEVPAYLAAIEALRKFCSYHAGLIRGFAGERRVFYAVKHIGFGFEQLVNAELDYEGEHDEFDQILVSRQGLVIIEVKNYSASATIGKDGILRFEYEGGRTCDIGERMASKRYVLHEIASKAIGRDLPADEIVSLVVNANEKVSVRNNYDELEVQSVSGLVKRIGELLGGDDVMGAEDVSAIKAAIEAAHHPVEIEPEVDFEYVSAALHEALALVAQTSVDKENSEEADLAQALDNVAFTEDHVRRPSIAFTSGVTMLFVGLVSGYVFGSMRKWR